MTDLYKSLGVSRGASRSEIRSAYRRLARRHHPDVSSSPDANEQFAQITKAYRILIDPRRRALYDRGDYFESPASFYAAHAAEVVAQQREFDRLVDEMLASERQETAARSHAVLVVVPLFLSVFYVMAARPLIFDELNSTGRVVIVLLAVYGLYYLVKNLSLVLSRYTYEDPDLVGLSFDEPEPTDKMISRKAGLVFLVCGLIVSFGLGHVVSRLLPVSSLSFRALLGVFLYPPIAVLIVGGIRRLGNFVDRT